MLCVALVRVMPWQGLEICAGFLPAELCASQAVTEVCFLVVF